MEVRLEQLVILALVVVVTLADLFLRWVRRKAGTDGRGDSADIEGELVFDEEADGEVRGPVWRAPEIRPAQALPPTPSPRQPPPAPIRFSPVMQPVTPGPSRRGGARRWLRDSGEAKRGIVLMAVLGPCRGMEASGREEA